MSFTAASPAITTTSTGLGLGGSTFLFPSTVASVNPQDLVILKGSLLSSVPTPSPAMVTAPSSSNGAAEPFAFQVHLHQHMMQVRQQQLFHLQQLQQAASYNHQNHFSQPHQTPLVSHSMPHFPSGRVGGGSGSYGSSLKAVSPLKTAGRVGRRASLMEEEDPALFVSPVCVEPRLRHLARQKLKFTVSFLFLI